MSDLVEPLRRPKNDFDCAIYIKADRETSGASCPAGGYPSSAKIQIWFDWSKAGGRLEIVLISFEFLI